MQWIYQRPRMTPGPRQANQPQLHLGRASGLPVVLWQLSCVVSGPYASWAYLGGCSTPSGLHTPFSFPAVVYEDKGDGGPPERQLPGAGCASPPRPPDKLACPLNAAARHLKGKCMVRYTPTDTHCEKAAQARAKPKRAEQGAPQARGRNTRGETGRTGRKKPAKAQTGTDRQKMTTNTGKTCTRLCFWE